ncbi:MAG: cob(I)yrinic acid a,c-diamide adenosyltransferase [Candidatus Binatia bacterium]
MPDKVYTRKGDDGTTQLLFAGKARVAKSSARVSAYGDGDEAVAALGVARAEATEAGAGDVAEIVLGLQRELFVLNAELATAPSDASRLEPGTSLVTRDMVAALERTIDDLNARFEQPSDFIVPGNSRLGASLDLAARVVRRAERSIDALAREEEVRPEARAYVNRLADLVWVLARYAERGDAQPKPRSS